MALPSNYESMKSRAQFYKLILFYEVAICKKRNTLDMVPTAAWYLLTRALPQFASHNKISIFHQVFF